MVSAKVSTVTPTLAKKWLAEKAHNRSISEGTVSKMASDMSADHWILNGESICISESGKLLDGQHRLAACIKANKAFESIVVSGLPEPAISSIDQGRARTTAHVLHMQGVANSSLAAAISRLLYTYDKLAVVGEFIYASRAEQLATYKKNASLIQHAASALGHLRKANRDLHFSSSSLGLCWLLFARKTSQAKATAFLDALADGDSKGAPASLRRYLRTRKPGTHRPQNQAPVTIKAWNAWLKGETPALLAYRSNESFPEVDG